MILPPVQVCTFTLGSRTYALDVSYVRSVLPWRPLQRVPRAPAMVEGLMNLRGEIVTAIDLRVVLDLPKRGKDSRSLSLVVTTQAGVAGLLVDGVGEVVEPALAGWEPSPSRPGHESHRLIAGAFKTPDGTVLLLDSPSLVEFCS